MRGELRDNFLLPFSHLFAAGRAVVKRVVLLGVEVRFSATLKHVVISKQTMEGNTVLKLNLAPGDGCAARFIPKP